MQMNFHASFPRFCVVFLAMVAWVHASSHCLLTNCAQPATSVSCCETHNGPAADAGPMICCQALLIVENVKVHVPTASLEVVLPVAAVDYKVNLPVGKEIGQLCDLTSPRVSRVLEIDLKRCHPAVAPPMLALI